MSTKKQMDAKQLIRQIVVYTLIFLLIGAFVIGLVASPFGNGGQAHGEKIVTVAGKTYRYMYDAPSAFNMVYGQMSDRFARYTGQKSMNESLRRIVWLQTTNVFTELAVMHRFAEDNGIKASDEEMKLMVQQYYQGMPDSAPSLDLLEYLKMQYSDNALSGTMGDFANVFYTDPSMTELYTYYMLETLTVQAEVLYLDLTNYLVSRADDAKVAEYYRSRWTNYTPQISLEQAAFGSKMTAYEFSQYAQTNGWDAAVKQFGTNVSVSRAVLSNGTGTMKRFNLALTMKPGEIARKPQYEEKIYYILKLDALPEYTTLSADLKQQVRQDYALVHMSELSAAFSGDIDALVNQAKGLLAAKPDLAAVSKALPFSYVKTAALNPLSDTLRDSGDIVVNLPYFENPAWSDFLFTAPQGRISEPFKAEGYVVFFKVDARTQKVFDISKVDQEAMSRYVSFKTMAAKKDWMASVSRRYKVQLHPEGMEKVMAAQNGRNE